MARGAITQAELDALHAQTTADTPEPQSTQPTSSLAEIEDGDTVVSTTPITDASDHGDVKVTIYKAGDTTQ